MTEGKSVLRSEGRWLKSRHMVVLLLVLLLVAVCAIAAGVVLVAATSSADLETANALTTAATLSIATTNTGNTNAGRVTLRRYCRFPGHVSGGKTEINCLIDSKDPNSTVHWSLVTKDGHTLDLGQCVGMRDTCQSPLSPNITLSRWYSWSTVTFSDSQLMSGNTLVCSASHRGSVRSDRCVLHEPHNKARTTTTTTTTTASTPNDQGTGRVSLRRYCSFPSEENGKATINCLIDSKDPNSTVHWSLVTKDGHTLDLGQCVGMRNTCQSPLSPKITLFRWYSWSTVTLPEAVARSGGTLVCSATHFGQQSSDQCVPYNEEGFEDCTVGESACRAKGWFDTGSINGVAVCCPPGQGLFINLSNKQHPCLC